MLSNNEIRNRILQILFDYYYEESVLSGIERSKMLELLQVPEKNIDANMLYLEQKGLITLGHEMGSLWTDANITAYGIDAIENKEKFKDQFQDKELQVLNSLLQSIKWHSDLAVIIQEYLNTMPCTSLTIDNLLSATTKLVEVYLKDAVQEFTGATVPSDSFAVNLLNYAKTKGFIPETKRGSECIYNFIYWYFEKPRNLTHHSFTHFLLPTTLMIISSTNYILDIIDQLRTKHTFYDAKRFIDYNQTSQNLSIKVEDIEKDRETISPMKVEMILTNPDKSQEHYPLNNEGTSWNLDANLYGKTQGTYIVSLVGYTRENDRFNMSGSSVVVMVEGSKTNKSSLE